LDELEANRQSRRNGVGHPSAIAQISGRTWNPDRDDERWRIIDPLNEVRNNVAHRAGAPEKAGAMRKLRTEYLRLHPEFSNIKDDPSFVAAAAIEAFMLLAEIWHALPKSSSKTTKSEKS
jgi:hypothetical protein